MDYSYIRYAVCWSPARDSALGEFGVNWTGWCPEFGEYADLDGERWVAPRRVNLPEALTNRGLIANIRSPFRLAEGRSRWSLERALDALVQKTPEIQMPDMVPMISGNQVIMAPNRTPQAVARLVEQVADMVRLFQAVPAPATPRAEREPADDLPPTDSGQPVVETFHVPITGRLTKDEAHRTVDWLGPVMSSLFADAGPIRAIDLMGDPGGGRPWRLVERYRLATDLSRWGIPSMPMGMACLGVPPATDVRKSNWDTVIA